MFLQQLTDLGIPALSNKPTYKNVKVACPHCYNRSGKNTNLSVHIGEGWYKCHSSKCEFQGNVGATAVPKYDLPEPLEEVAVLNRKLIDHFAARGISKKTLEKLQITQDKGAIFFNYFENGTRVNYKARTYDKSRQWQMANAKKTMYNIDSCKGKTKAIIVEGEPDVAALVEAGLDEEYGIISIDQGAGSDVVYNEDGTIKKHADKLDGKLECMNNCSKQLDLIQEFVLFLDLDGPGAYTQKEIIRRLGPERCKFVDPSIAPTIKDANDVLMLKGQDPKVNKVALYNIIKKAVSSPIPGVQVLEGRLKELMLKYFREGKPKGVPSIVLPHFKYLPGMMTLFTGIPGHGKGVFSRYMAMTMAKRHGWKYACYCPEDYPLDDFYDDLCHMYLQKSVDIGYSNRCTEQEYLEALEFVKEHFIALMAQKNNEGIMSLPDNQILNKNIAYLKLKFGINSYIKDPWNKITHHMQGREDQYLQSELSKEKLFAEQYSSAFYIAHPKTMHKNKNGVYPVPEPYDISGGSMWYNGMDNLFTVHRPNYHLDKSDRTVEIHNWKNKNNRRAGRPQNVTMIYDIAKNSYNDKFDQPAESEVTRAEFITPEMRKSNPFL